jgi:hypothetical protein
MQLDLFSDNFYTIRLNEATELLHALVGYYGTFLLYCFRVR